MDYILILVMLVLFVCSLFMIRGKGTFLIQGSGSDSNRFDTKKLTKITGCMLLFITVLMGLQIIFEDQIPSWIFIVGVLISIVSVYFNQYTICRNKDYKSIPKQKRNKKVDKFKIIVKTFGCVVVIGFGAVIMLTGSIDITMKKTSITFGATMTSSKTISYEDIEKIEIQDELQSGRRVGGISNFKIDAGNFKNDEFGQYRRYTNGDCDVYIIVTMNDGEIIVVNKKTVEDTKKLYQELETRSS